MALKAFMRSITVGSVSAFRAASLSLSMIGRGVFGGANRAFQV